MFWSLGFSPDSRWLVSGSWGGFVNMWEVSGDNQIPATVGVYLAPTVTSFT